MYDDYFADTTLNSVAFRKKAVDEVKLIMEKSQVTSGKVLDVPCGTGRHSYLFGKKGFQVTGIDISEACLAIARKQWSHRNVTYKAGNMNDLREYREQYDLVVNLFTSFGYFATDKQNELVMREFYRALKPRGTFVLNLINPNWLETVFQPVDWQENADEYVLHRRKIEKNYVEATMKVVQKKSKAEREYYFRHRLYTKSDLFRLLKKTGFRKVSVVGDFLGSKFSERGSTHPYFFAVK